MGSTERCDEEIGSSGEAPSDRGNMPLAIGHGPGNTERGGEGGKERGKREEKERERDRLMLG